MLDNFVQYGYEIERPLRVGLIGCGGQAFRNILPCAPYLPISIVACADPLPGRAAAFSQLFQVGRSYLSSTDMLDKEHLDAVLVVSGYDTAGNTLHFEHAKEALEAGCHAWIEKPPANSTAEIESLNSISNRVRKQVGFGFMKMFTPTAQKVKELVGLPEFGRVTSFYLRDAEQLQPELWEQGREGSQYFLDHFPHPASLIRFLMGRVESVYVTNEINGAAFIALNFSNGAVGMLHLPWGESRASIKERLEVVGSQANIEASSSMRITYYRDSSRGGIEEYGRSAVFTTDTASAPLVWELDGYSGQPYNSHIFYQGYARALGYFFHCLLRGENVATGGLSDAWHVMAMLEAVRSSTNRQVALTRPPAWVAA